MPNEDNDGTFAVETRGSDMTVPAAAPALDSSPADLDAEKPPSKPRTAARARTTWTVLSLEYARTRDPQTRERLILHHQRLVHYIAARFLGSGETLEDSSRSATSA